MAGCERFPIQRGILNSCTVCLNFGGKEKQMFLSQDQQQTGQKPTAALFWNKSAHNS